LFSGTLRIRPAKPNQIKDDFEKEANFESGENEIRVNIVLTFIG
jgi:hypothetical protein